MAILDTFLDRLIKLERWERRRFLEGVYKQVAVSKKGKQAKGMYRDLIETAGSEEKHNFVFVLAYNMKSYGLEIQTKRLLEYYKLGNEFKEFEESGTIRFLRNLKGMYELAKR